MIWYMCILLWNYYYSKIYKHLYPLTSLPNFFGVDHIWDLILSFKYVIQYVVTVLYIRSLDIINFIVGSVYPLTNISSFTLHLASGNHNTNLHFYEFNSFRFNI